MPKACDIELIKGYIKDFLQLDYRTGCELLSNLVNFSLFDISDKRNQFRDSYLRFLALKKINFLRKLKKFPDHLDDIDIDSPLQEFKSQLQAIAYLKTIKTIPCSIHINKDSPLFVIRDWLSFYSGLTPARVVAELTPLRVYMHLLAPILEADAEIEVERAVVLTGPIETKVAELAKSIVKLEQDVAYHLDELRLARCCHADVVDFTVDKLMAKDDLIFHSLLLESLCAELGIPLSGLFNLLVPGCPDCNAESYIGCCSQSLAMYPFLLKLREQKDEFKAILNSSSYGWISESNQNTIIDLFSIVMEKRWTLSTVQGVDSLNWVAFYRKYMAIPTTAVISPVRFPLASKDSRMTAFLKQCAQDSETSLFSKIVVQAVETPDILTPRGAAVLRRMD